MSMIAVTIGVGEKWRRLAALAADACRAMTGLTVHILGKHEMERCQCAMPHHLKFHLFDTFPDAEALLYFDADMAFRQRWDPCSFAGLRDLVAVADRAQNGAVIVDSSRAGVAADDYFNSGLFIANRAHHAEWLRLAGRIADEGFASAFHDQGQLNAARVRLGLAVHWLPSAFNRLDFDRCGDPGGVVVGHFADIDSMPTEEMERHFRAWLGDGPRDSRESSPPDFKSHRRLAREFIAAIPHYPAERFGGRGIVIPAGGEKYFACAWVCLKMLRATGCTLPVEFWHLGPEEMPPAAAAMLEPLGAVCVDALALREKHPCRILNGWELKAYALVHCRFAEVILLDADNVPLADPDALFHTAEYIAMGTIFWPDYGRLGPDREIWRIAEIPYRDESEIESGQIVIDKARCWAPLLLSLHYNEYSDFYYRYIHGDKETFHLAWRRLGRDYAMPARGIESLNGIMCQHDFAGRRIFQHRNQFKWSLHGQNPRIPGFRLHDECVAALDELRRLLPPPAPSGVRRWSAKNRSGAARAAAGELCSGVWRYHRVGCDMRPMTFRPDGSVGRGAALSELVWDIRDDGDSVTLEVFGEACQTAGFQRVDENGWRGAWDPFEKMPCELLRSSD